MKLSELPESGSTEKLDRWDQILIGFLVCLLVHFLAVMVSVSVEDFVSCLVGYTEKSEILEFLGIGMGGILLALQAKASYRRAKAMERTAQAQAAATRATEQGNRQERLKNAIEHLGHESSISMRLGGAYELFHLAEDTEALRKTALDILCAHIRRTTGEAGYQKEYKAKPSEEVQSLLTLLFVRGCQVFKGLRADLQGSFLNRAVLNNAHLQRANLWRARMRGADLRMARLGGAHLQRADLGWAHLGEADLRGAHLQGADLERAQLGGADLGRAHLQGADLMMAYLGGADLGGAHLQGADLRGAGLQGADLRGAGLQGADLRGAGLQGVVLRGAGLQGVVLGKTQLQAAALSGADLRGAGELRISYKHFADHMNEAIGEWSDVSEVVFEGGLSQEDVDSWVKDLSDEKANELRSKLESHVGRPEVRGVLPKNCGAKLDAYSWEDAKQWIDEYNEAMSEVPEDQ